jgi:hypothetical protein
MACDRYVPKTSGDNRLLTSWQKVCKTFVPEHELHWTGWVAFRAVFDADRLKDAEYPEDAAHWVSPEDSKTNISLIDQ